MNTITQRIACKGVILHNKKILLLREAKTYKDGTNIGKYQIPGGRVEVGEPYKDGIRREILEETGLTIEIGKPFFVGEWFPTIQGVNNQIVAIFFHCITKSDKVTLSDEHDRYAWINPQEWKDYDLSDSEGEMFKEYIRSIG